MAIEPPTNAEPQYYVTFREQNSVHDLYVTRASFSDDYRQVLKISDEFAASRLATAIATAWPTATIDIHQISIIGTINYPRGG